MRKPDFTTFTDNELLEEKKKLKPGNLISSFLIGLFIGISVYGSVKNGFGFFTLFPLFFAYLMIKSGEKYRAVEKEIKARKLV